MAFVTPRRGVQVIRRRTETALGSFPSRSFYVDATLGNDANSGMRPDEAWQTYDPKVNGETFLPGDRILGKCGETWAEQVVVPSSGVAGRPITFGAYGSGALPALDASVAVTSWTDNGGNVWWATHTVDPVSCVKVDGVPGNLVANVGAVVAAGDFFWDTGTDRLYVYSVGAPTDVEAANVAVGVGEALFYSLGKDYITVENLAVNFSVYHGIALFNGSGIIVRSCSLDLDYGMGVLCDICTDVSVERCTVVDYGTPAWAKGINLDTVTTGQILDSVVYRTATGPTASEGIGVGASSNILVAGNEVYGLNNLAIYIESWDGAQNNVLVDSNLVHDINESGIVHACELGFANDNVTFSNNIVHSCNRAGIWLGEWPATVSDNILIINNTIYDCGLDGGWFDGGIVLQNTLLTNVVVRNNLCYDNDQFQIYQEAGFTATVDHNLIWQFQGHAREVIGTDAVQADPLLVNAPGDNFHLLVGSPARGAGSATAAPDDDYDDVPRGDPPDIGAYEYIA